MRTFYYTAAAVFRDITLLQYILCYAHYATPLPVVILLNAIFYKRTLRSNCSKRNNRLFIKN